MLRRPLTIPKRAHPLVKRLYISMNKHQISPREVERRAGLSHLLLNSWRQNRQKPDIDCIIAALNVVGVRFCVKETDFIDGKEIVPVNTKLAQAPIPDESWEIVC